MSVEPRRARQSSVISAQARNCDSADAMRVRVLRDGRFAMSGFYQPRRHEVAWDDSSEKADGDVPGWPAHILVIDRSGDVILDVESDELEGPAEARRQSPRAIKR